MPTSKLKRIGICVILILVVSVSKFFASMGDAMQPTAWLSQSMGVESPEDQANPRRLSKTVPSDPSSMKKIFADHQDNDPNIKVPEANSLNATLKALFESNRAKLDGALRARGLVTTEGFSSQVLMECDLGWRTLL
jgi:hypothetical protein